MSEKDGVLEMDLDPSTAPTQAFAGTHKQFDMTSCTVSAKLAEVTKSGVSAESSFGLARNASEHVAFVKRWDTLDVEIWKDGVVMTSSSHTYSPLWHGWWRFRVGAKLHWEVSNDGKSWTELDSAELPFPLSAVSINSKPRRSRPSPSMPDVSASTA